MTGVLRCYSFHSVKGGVGKSTLATLTAVALASEHPEAQVYLVDMDLTGTSLADVLPLEAPKWNDVAPGARLDLLKSPAGFHDHQASRRLLEEREEARSREPVGVPFLNDHLLFMTPDWDDETDVPPEAIAWRLRGGPENLRVFPSSALPHDLERALPVIYAEEHAAYLEGRLEYLLAALISEEHSTYVVFDTPPTIPGLSRSVLSLALRLSQDPRQALSEDEEMPGALADADLHFSAYVVATHDFQDIRAAERWLRRDQEAKVIHLVLNRVEGQAEQREQLLRRAFREPGEGDGALRPEDAEPERLLARQLEKPVWIEEGAMLRELFRREGTPAVPLRSDLLRKLDEAGQG